MKTKKRLSAFCSLLAGAFILFAFASCADVAGSKDGGSVSFVISSNSLKSIINSTDASRVAIPLTSELKDSREATDSSSVDYYYPGFGETDKYSAWFKCSNTVTNETTTYAIFFSEQFEFIYTIYASVAGKTVSALPIYKGTYTCTDASVTQACTIGLTITAAYNPENKSWSEIPETTEPESITVSNGSFTSTKLAGENQSFVWQDSAPVIGEEVISGSSSDDQTPTVGEIKIRISLVGDYNASQVVTFTRADITNGEKLAVRKTVSFDNIPVGSSVSAVAVIYETNKILDGGKTYTDTLAFGASGVTKIEEGMNNISFVLKGFDDSNVAQECHGYMEYDEKTQSQDMDMESYYTLTAYENGCYTIERFSEDYFETLSLGKYTILDRDSNNNPAKLTITEYVYKTDSDYQIGLESQTFTVKDNIFKVKLRSNGMTINFEISPNPDNPEVSGTGMILIDNPRVSIQCNSEEPLYLNCGNISVSAYKTDEYGAPLKLDTDCISVKLLYGGTVLDSEYWQWVDDGFVMIGNESSLVSGGTYQVYVAVQDSESSTVAASAMFNVEILDAVYYEYDTSASDFVTQLSYDMKMLTCPAVVKVIGEGTETDSENNITGTLKNISMAIQGNSSDGYNNLAFPVELDLSEVTGVTKVAQNDIQAIALCSVELPKTVTSIETNGFNLSSVYASDSDVYSKLESFTIPSGVTSIACQPFYNCSSLKKISVAEGNKNFSTVMDGTILLSNESGGVKLVCTAAVTFEEIDFASEELSAVTVLEKYAFDNAKSIGTNPSIVTVKNLDKITSFGDKAFANKSIGSLTITSIPELADEVYPFYYTQVKNLTIDCDVTEDNFDAFERFVAYLYTGSTYHYRYGISNIENLVFNGYAYIKDTSSPSSSATNGEVDAYMFYSSRSTLEIIQFNKGAYVGKYQFQKEFSKLKTVTFAGSEESVIGDSAFAQNSEYSTGITSLTLNGVTTIGDYAFNYNNGLNTLTIPSTVTSLAETAFSGCSGIESLEVESGNTNYKSSPNGQFLITADGALMLAIGDISDLDFTDSGVKSISSTPFWNRETSITKLNLSGVEHLGQQAFYNCQNLAEVEWGTTLKSIGNLAFYSINITDITLPDSIIALAPSAFQEYVATGTATQYTSFTIGGVGADSASQPTNWYMLKGSDKATLWQNYIDNKPSTITESDDIVKLPASSSTETVIQTIQTDVCNQYQRSNSKTTGNGYYYYRLVD